MNIYTEKCHIGEKDDPKYTVTTDIGDILDISYFARRIGFPSVFLLIEQLKENKIDFKVVKDILIFDTEDKAKKACECFAKMNLTVESI